MDELEWTECGETLDDLLKNPRVQLPQVIKLSSSITDVKTSETAEKGQYVVIHSKETIKRLEGTNALGKTLAIPFHCPHKIRRRVAPGKEKIFNTINELAKTEPLPKFVEVQSLESSNDDMSVGDRLKVVIVEKTGGVPSFIHLRSSAGKHVRLSVEDKISFQLSVNDGSEQLISKLAEKSREFPLNAEFAKKKELPKPHADAGTFTVKNSASEEVVIASFTKNDNTEYALVFPLHSAFKFQINSKLKMAKDEAYRELCNNASNVNAADIFEFVGYHDPHDLETTYVIRYKKLLKILKFDYSDDSCTPSPKIKSKVKEKEKVGNKKEPKSSKKESKQNSPDLNEKRTESPEIKDEENDEDAETLPLNTLVQHTEQKEIMKREIKERERQAKLERERIKAEKKKEKKEKKEKEKEEKKKKKLSSSSSTPSSPIETVDEDLYIVPQQAIPENEDPEITPTTPGENDEGSSSQLALFLMNKVKKVRDRTQSLGKPKQKKQRKFRKEDIEYISSDGVGTLQDEESFYTGLCEDPFEESLYEALPSDMAYESLDLVAQAKRSLVPQSSLPAENSGDSGFDEIDQARIKAWRDAMVPPPLPGNHPVKQPEMIPTYDDENLYEMAVDAHSAQSGNTMDAWQRFNDSVQQSTTEISSWDMEDVAKCLEDLLLDSYIDIFNDSQVDGQLLLDLDESVLVDLGLSVFESRKLRKFVFGWRPDIIRPKTYPELKGFDSKDPAEWSQVDVVSHLKIIEINDFADFCDQNQVNGELLKDICVDESIMSNIITTRDRKLKSVKIKNYVIDQWRPKKKGEGNYMHSNSILPPEKREENSKSNSPKNTKSSTKTLKSNDQSHKANTLGMNKKTADGSRIAKMKQQLEETKNSWEQKKKPVDYI